MGFPRWRARWKAGSGRVQLDANTEFAPALVAVVGEIDQAGVIKQDNRPQLVYRRHFFKKQAATDPVDICVINSELGLPISEIGDYEVRIHYMLDEKGDAVAGDDLQFRLKSDADFVQWINCPNAGEPLVGTTAGTPPTYSLFPVASSITTGWNILQFDALGWAAAETFWYHFIVEIYKLPTGILKSHSTDTP